MPIEHFCIPPEAFEGREAWYTKVEARLKAAGASVAVDVLRQVPPGTVIQVEGQRVTIKGTGQKALRYAPGTVVVVMPWSDTRDPDSRLGFGVVAEVNPKADPTMPYVINHPNGTYWTRTADSVLRRPTQAEWAYYQVIEGLFTRDFLVQYGNQSLTAPDEPVWPPNY